jgi:hypothetical protein
MRSARNRRRSSVDDRGSGPAEAERRLLRKHALQCLRGPQSGGANPFVDVGSSLGLPGAPQKQLSSWAAIRLLVGRLFEFKRLLRQALCKGRDVFDVSTPIYHGVLTPTHTTDWFGRRRAERDALQLAPRNEALPATWDPLAALSTRSLARPYSTRMPDGSRTVRLDLQSTPDT